MKEHDTIQQKLHIQETDQKFWKCDILKNKTKTKVNTKLNVIDIIWIRTNDLQLRRQVLYHCTTVTSHCGKMLKKHIIIQAKTAYSRNITKFLEK